MIKQKTNIRVKRHQTPKPDIYTKISIISINLSYEVKTNVVTAVTDIIVSSRQHKHYKKLAFDEETYLHQNILCKKF